MSCKLRGAFVPAMIGRRSQPAAEIFLFITPMIFPCIYSRSKLICCGPVCSPSAVSSLQTTMLLPRWAPSLGKRQTALHFHYQLNLCQRLSLNTLSQTESLSCMLWNIIHTAQSSISANKATALYLLEQAEPFGCTLIMFTHMNSSPHPCLHFMLHQKVQSKKTQP